MYYHRKHLLNTNRKTRSLISSILESLNLKVPRQFLTRVRHFQCIKPVPWSMHWQHRESLCMSTSPKFVFIEILEWRILLRCNTWEWNMLATAQTILTHFNYVHDNEYGLRTRCSDFLAFSYPGRLILRVVSLSYSCPSYKQLNGSWSRFDTASQSNNTNKSTKDDKYIWDRF
jgi:hypothetical protein